MTKLVKKYSGELPSLKITHKGVFIFKELYVLIHDFLKQNGFVAHDYPEHGGDPDLYEVSFLVKGTELKNYIIQWKSKKIPSESSYFRYKLDIKIEGRLLVTKEVVHEGKKLEMDSGEIIVSIKGEVETDYTQAWEKHWLLRNFVNMYDKKIMKDEIEATHEDGLFGKMLDLQNSLKRYFRLQGGAETAPLWPERPGP